MADQKETPIVGIIMGSESDMPAMEPCMAQLDAFGVPYEVKVASAHRKPAEVHAWAQSARERGKRHRQDAKRFLCLHVAASFR